MSSPQNLNNSSPGALSTGAPPAVELTLAPAPQTPSTSEASASPPAAPNASTPNTNAGGGSTQSQSGSAASSAQPGAANGAGGGASPSSANGLGGNVVPVPPTLGDALSNCCGTSSSGSSGSTAPRMNNVTTTGPTYAAAFGDNVIADPTGGNIVVDLPAANSVTPTGSNIITITNNSDSVNTVTATPAAGDNINGAATFVLAARESVTLVAATATEWLPF